MIRCPLRLVQSRPAVGVAAAALAALVLGANAACTTMGGDAASADAATAGTAPAGGAALIAPPPAGAPDAAPSAGWQSTLVGDVVAVETKGDAFLTVSFELYDQLLGGATPSPVVAKSAQLSADRYAELTEAVDRLRLDLARPDIAASLARREATRSQDFVNVGTVFSTYQKLAKRPITYDQQGGPSVTAVVFGGAETPGGANEYAELPKAQRDALRLLDALNGISMDLAYVSHTVTEWVDVRADVADETAH